MIFEYRRNAPNLARCLSAATLKVAVLSLFSATLLAGAGCTRPEGRLVNRTVIDVNGQTINTKDFAERLARHLRNRDPLTVKDPQLLEKAKSDLADALVLQLVAEQWAAKNGISVVDADIDKKVAEVRAEYSDELAFRKMLADENLAIEAWREELRSSLLRKKVYDKITEAVAVPTESELRAAYEAGKKNYQRGPRIRLRQVVLDKEEDAKRVYEEFAKGRDLGALAKQFSIAPEAAENGDTGWVEKGALEVFDQAFKLPVGGKSKIVKSPYGWHIYQVIAKEGDRKLTYDQVKPALQREFREQRSQALFAKWLESQLRTSSVKRDEAILKSIVLSTRTE